MPRILLLWLWVACVAGFAGAGCTSKLASKVDHGRTQAPTPTPVVASAKGQIVGPEGAVVKSEQVNLVVPAGTFAKPVDVRLSPYRSPLAFPGVVATLGQPTEIEIYQDDHVVAAGSVSQDFIVQSILRLDGVDLARLVGIILRAGATDPSIVDTSLLTITQLPDGSYRVAFPTRETHAVFSIGVLPPLSAIPNAPAIPAPPASPAAPPASPAPPPAPTTPESPDQGGLTPRLLTIDVVASAAQVARGRSLQLTATGHYSDGTTGDLTAAAAWSATPGTGSATVSSAGLVGTQSATLGTVTIVATKDGSNGQLVITVVAAEPATLTIAPPAANVPLGLTRAFTANATYTDGTVKDVTTEAAWTRANGTGSASIDAATGRATTAGGALGTVTIHCAWSGLSGDAALTVGSPELQTIVLTPATKSLALGEAQNFTAQGTYTDGSSKDVTNSVTWSAIDGTGSASINSLGHAVTRGGTAGDVTMRATSSGVHGDASLTVTPAVIAGLAVAPKPSYVVASGTKALVATATYTDGTTSNVTGSATWQTDNAPKATVVAGVVTGVATGTANITASIASPGGTLSDITVVTVFTGTRCAGSGAVNDPYIVCDYNTLDHMRDSPGSDYRIGQDIDASASHAGAGWLPFAFTGTLNGNDKTISHLFINRGSTDQVGLLASSSKSVTHLNLTDVDITGHTFVGGLVGRNTGNIDHVSVAGVINGLSYAGGLMGDHNGAGKTVSDCSTDVVIASSNASDTHLGAMAGDFQSGTLTNSVAAGSVTGNGGNNGGFVGYLGTNGTISNSRTYASLTTNSNSIANQSGGFVGITYGTIVNCHAYGDVVTKGGNVGGFAGFVDGGTVSGSSAGGDVTGSTTYPAQLGGFTGALRNATTISDSWATGNVSSPEAGAIGGFVGILVSGTITQSFATGDVSGTNNIGGFGGEVHGSNIRRSFALGRVTGTSNSVGGFTGQSGGTIDDCYARSAVTGSSVTGAFAGNVVGGSINTSFAEGSSSLSAAGTVGGFAGQVASGASISSSFTRAALSGANTAGGFVGNNAGTVAGSWYRFAGNPKTACAGANTGSVASCVEQTDSDWYFERANAPLNAWNFTSYWTMPGFPALPKLTFAPGPILVVTKVPGGRSAATVLAGKVLGDTLGGYRYKLGLADEIDCSNEVDYGAEKAPGTAITDSIQTYPAGSTVKLCIIGKDLGGTWDDVADARVYTWTRK